MASDFPFLPAGCSIDLDRKSREIVLDNLKAAANRARWQSLVADLVGESDDVTLRDFLVNGGFRLASVYRGGRSWTQLRREAGRRTQEPQDADLEADTLRALGRMTHIDDPERVSFYRELLQHGEPPGLTSSTSASAA